MTPITADTLMEGGVYILFSGDKAAPYSLVKILKITEQRLWVKLYHDTFPEMPPFDASATASIMNVSIQTFFSWAPPQFPITYLKHDAVGLDELQSCVASNTNVLDYTRVDP